MAQQFKHHKDYDIIMEWIKNYLPYLTYQEIYDYVGKRWGIELYEEKLLLHCKKNGIPLNLRHSKKHSIRHIGQGALRKVYEKNLARVRRVTGISIREMLKEEKDEE